jgi:hypothetical protein
MWLINQKSQSTALLSSANECFRAVSYCGAFAAVEEGSVATNIFFRNCDARSISSSTRIVSPVGTLTWYQALTAALWLLVWRRGGKGREVGDFLERG